MLFRLPQDAVAAVNHVHPIDFFARFIISTLCLLLFSCGDPGDRPWKSHAISISAGTSEPILTIALTDLDQDGRPEVLASRENSDSIYIYISEPSEQDGLLWTQHQIPVAAGIQQFHIWKAGTRDQPESFLVVAAGEPSMQVVYAPLPVADEFLEAEAWKFSKIPVPAGDWSAMHSSDFNNDGISDLALAGRSEEPENSSAPEVIWMSDARTGERAVVTIGESASPLLVYAADVEEDGDIDLLVVDAAPGASSMGAYWLENPWPENPAVQWKRNFITLSSLRPVGARVADFDGDQHQDLLISLQENAQSHRLMCFKKVSAATEVAWLPLPLPISGRQGALAHSHIADIDRDGFTDLVLGYRDATDPLEHLLWLRNPTPEAASPTWVRKTLSGRSQGSATAGMILSDVDGDGDTDVISADDGGVLRWYENTFPAATEEDQTL